MLRDRLSSVRARHRKKGPGRREGAVATAIVSVAGTAALVLGLVVSPGQSADAATFTLTATRASSGTTTVDSAGTCPAQGGSATAHCAGYDVSLLATDQILRTGDTANVRFDFAFDGADTGVVLRATLPEQNGGPAAIWTALPPACAAGSTRTDANRTLNCHIANPPGAGDGSVTATLRLEARAYDGYTFTVPATIQSDTSAAIPATSTATFTTSSAPMWNIRKNVSANTLPVPFFYRSATGDPGFAIPTSTGVAANKVGGYSPLDGPVTWTETMTSTTALDPADYQLLNWGNYGDGCASQGQAASPANGGYPSTAVGISNQVGPVAASDYDCAQPGGPGTPVQVTWQNPPVAATGYAANMWIMLWVPIADIPIGTTQAPTMTVTDFDPDDVNGVNNFIAGTEPTTDNARAHGLIVNADNRSVVKRPNSDSTTPYSSAFPGADGSTLREQSFISLVTFQNIGTVSQTPVQVCDVLDVTTQRVTPFATSGGLPADTYAVVTTTGPTGDPITAPPYQPAAGYNNSTNFAVDPTAYLVEFAAGELGGTTPTTAPLPETAFTGVGCGDTSTATGWHADPNDAAITTYAASLGLSDPFDVINRVRVTFVGGAIQPGQMVGVKVHSTTRSVYRAATSQAGQTIYATTRIGDVATYDYPQISIAPWTTTAYAGPVISGRIDVNTAIDIRSAVPDNVQAGAPGQNRTTFTLRPSIAFGENVATTQPMRVLFHLPAGLRYVAGSASLAPEHVLPQTSGATVLVWDLGDVTGTTNGVTILPDFTFVAEADPLAPTPSTNYSTAVAESVSPTGSQIDLDPPITACGTMLQVTIPPTSNVPVQTVSEVPPPGNYSGCIGQGRNRRMDAQTVIIGNAFLSLAAYKTALEPLLESGADDGVAGAEVGWDLLYRNTTSNDFPGVDIVDVLPYPGDGRSPESDFSGTVELSSVATTDALSVTPNALPVSAATPGPRNGTTLYVTNRPSAQVERDPYDAGNLLGGATTWCLIADLGSPGCPATLAEATAVRIISGELATGDDETVRLGFATEGASAGDLMTNTAVARVISVLTPVDISGDTIEFAASSIAGTIWEDENADGVIDGSESVRLPGVSVRIQGTATTSGDPVDRTVTTGADGSYAFTGLPAGSYTVTVDQATARAVAAGYGLTYDPDGVATPDGSFALTLPLGTDVTGRNFGFGTSSLAGTVFGDDDNDGAIDAGESGVSGVTVTLSGTDDLGQAVSRTATTDGAGSYTFPDVRPGDYQLVVTPPATLLGGQNVPGTAGGTAGAVGSNTISDVTLEAGQNGVTYLFGLLEPEIVEGVVYEDTNADGDQDPGEPGIPGVTITLSGDADLTTVTVADGRFLFGGLTPGDYEIAETQPSGYLNGTNATNGSVGTVSGDTITDIVVGAASTTDGYSFGEVPMAGISGFVYDDLNANGVRDTGEPGIPGAQVSLTGADTQGPVTTGADGSYTFTGLAAGTYNLTSTEAAGFIDGLETVGSAGGTPDPSNGGDAITGIVLGAGERVTGYLFGDVRVASVAGIVFADTDGDGGQDAGEPGIGGATVTLTGTDLFGDAVTTPGGAAGDGTFSFGNLVPGVYTLAEDQPAAFFDGTDTAGSTGGTVSNDLITGIALGSGATGTGYRFAERAAVSLGGVVFADVDGDGVQDAGENGIPGVTIAIENTAGFTDTAVTLADGSWSFTGLPPGTYTVTEQGPPPVGHVDGLSTAGTAGGTAATNVISGIVLDAPADGYRFAEIPLSIIRGTVWHDQDDDGVIDAGEPRLPGVTITLGGDAARTTTTAADGTFVFGGLSAGTYTITEEALASWSDGATLVGPAGGTAGVNTVTGIALLAGTDAAGYGFGERAADLQITVLAQAQDAQNPTGPYVVVGDQVRLIYTVTNNGDTSLEDIEVADDVLGPVVCPATVLAPGADMDCTLDTPAIVGQHEHNGSVVASVVPRVPGGPAPQLNASDVANYFGMIATASLTVEVEGQSAVTSPGPVFPSGSTLGVVATITNTGNVPLVLDSLDDGGLGSLDCGAVVTLAPGSSLACTVDVSPPAGNYAFPLAATLLAPDASSITGDPVPATAVPVATLFFQVAPAATQLPSQIALTGVELGWGPILAISLMLLMGGALVGIGRRRMREDGVGHATSG